MANNKLIEYFNKLNSKDLNFNEIFNIAKSLKSEQTLNAAITINFADYVAKNYGSNRNYCPVYDNEASKKFAFLKTKQVVKKAEQQFITKYNSAILKLNQKLIDSGALVQKLYSIFYADKKYCELQGLFEGRALYVGYIDKLLKNVINKTEEDFIKDNISKKEENKLGNYIFNYNLNSQKILLNLPQEGYDQLFNTHLILDKLGLRFEDCHCENVLVSNKGFSIIDLDYKGMLENIIENKTLNDSYFDSLTRNSELVSYYLEAFRYSNYLDKFFTEKQSKILQNNNIPIFKKLFSAVLNSGIKFDPNYGDLDQIYFDVFGLANYATEVKKINNYQIAAKPVKHKPIKTEVIKEELGLTK